MFPVRTFSLPALVLALSFPTVAAPGRARAQSEPASDFAEDPATVQARAFFEDGLALADEGDWERATHRFRSALELREAAPLRYNLALALSEMGRLTEAMEQLDLLSVAPDADAALLEGALGLRTRLAPRLGRLTVEVEGPQDGLHVTVDGRPWQTVGRPGLADPGIRIVRLMREAAELDLEEADVPEGGEASLVLEVPGADGGAIPPWVWGLVTHLSLAALGALGTTLVILAP